MPAVSLRPMNLGEVLDRTFSLYKGNFLLFFGVMAWPSVFAMGFALVNTILQSVAAKPQAGVVGVYMVAGLGGGFFLLMLAYWIAYTIALGATTFAVSDVYLGNNATIWGSFRKMRGRTWRLMRLMGWIGLQLMGVVILLAIAMPMLIAATPGSVGRGVGIVLVIIMIPVLIFLPIWIMLRNSVAVPALMLENLKAREASRRSVRLMKGNLGRAFLVVLLMVLVTYTVMFIFQGPFLVAAVFMSSHGQPNYLMMGLGSVLGAVGGALAAPLLMIGLVLLYYDIRVRKEAFDLQLLMGPPLENAAGDTPAAAAAPSI
jgi:hypothetical protein